MTVFIHGNIYSDRKQTQKLETPLGPFEDDQAAQAWVEELNQAGTPLYGDLFTVVLHDPELQKRQHILWRAATYATTNMRRETTSEMGSL